MCFLLITLFIFISSVSSDDPYKCKPVTEVTPNGNMNYSFPSYYSTSKAAYPFAAGQKCSWKINVPQGMYAYLDLRSNVASSDKLLVFDSLKVSESILGDHRGDQGYYSFFVSPEFDVYLDSSNKSTGGVMSFQVFWFKFPAQYSTTKYKLNKSSPSAILDSLQVNQLYVMTSETKVSIIGFPYNVVAVIPLMRAIFVYDGPNWNSTYLGSLYELMGSKKQTVSSGTTLSIVTAVQFVNSFVVLAQDYQNTADIKQYQGISCYYGKRCKIQLDATTGPAAVSTNIHTAAPTGNAEYLTDFKLQDTNAQLNVYIGGKTNDGRNQIATYTSNQSTTHLPQEFWGTFRTYYLTSGTATIELSGDYIDARWHYAYEGRRGFMASSYYMTGLQGAENTVNTLSGNLSPPYSRYKFTFVVQSADLPGNSTLAFAITDQVKATIVENINKNFNHGSIGSALKRAFSADGDTFSVVNSNFGQPSGGYYLDFSIDQAGNLSGIQGYLLSASTTVLMLLISTIF